MLYSTVLVCVVCMHYHVPLHTPSDEALREKVLGLIEKQKRQKKPPSTDVTIHIGPPETRNHSRKASTHSMNDIMTEQKPFKIEVEASVNTRDDKGVAGTIIQIEGKVVRHLPSDVDHDTARQPAVTKSTSASRGNHIADPTPDHQSLKAPSLSPEHRTGSDGGGGGGDGDGGGGGGRPISTSPERRSIKVVPSTGSLLEIGSVPHISVEDGGKDRLEHGATVWKEDLPERPVVCLVWCVCVFVRVCVRVCVHACVCVLLCVHVCAYAYRYMYVGVCIYVCMHPCLCACL